MSFVHTVALGAVAGFTIYLGLPIGRLRLLSDRSRVAMAMFAVGVLVFIFVDVLSHAESIVNSALDAVKDNRESSPYLLSLIALLGGGFATGSAGLAAASGWISDRRRVAPATARRATTTARPATTTVHPATTTMHPATTTMHPATTTMHPATTTMHPATATEVLAPALDTARAEALRTGLTVAAAIGVHNFAEGLAIGVSAREGAITLATVLVVGFALHNATEGFGIVGPLGDVTPPWRWIGLAGVIGGGPTFLGSIIGYRVTSHPLQLVAYAVAGGAILYVIGEVWNGMRRYGYREVGLLALSAGFLAGVATDLVVAFAGG